MTKAQALLAPVPALHIVSGDDVCRVHGSVIFGSDRWGLFEDHGVNEGAPVYLYASMTGEKGAPMVTWQAEFARVIRHEDLTSQDRKRRPSSTAGPGESPWAVFWEVDRLRELESQERIPTGTFVGYKSGKQYKKNFVPEGPLIVAR